MRDSALKLEPFGRRDALVEHLAESEKSSCATAL